ncbi:hypothetical protein GRI62_04035 [Erythrobacter arachoides]|uniref:DUF4105 domain-containing protein n=1 Tax=Aurantiacibacter arachoides TaxID=1850444 RepID=A0A844ZYJ7_9SPHN|nr:hypothetical protein [Aurantiacibacter arachoides]MXO92778.1 hypothetical protein [Aurantiacibacter arachoides]GGD54555.1 hypothetical protein GCM10011411_13120 [Aurantiacibacter arachoides]
MTISPLRKFVAALLLMLGSFGFATPALADVQVSFHSFNGSVLWGRYPHTFIVLDGTLANGTRVNENYGFSARNSAEAITQGPAQHMILTETANSIAQTNRHFTVTVNDQTYRRLRAEVIAWRDYPGRYYDLDERNCIHFVSRMAQLVGLRSDVPSEYVRRPKAWLNYITRRNPQLGAAEIA